MIPWLRFQALNAEGTGSSPSQGTKINMQHGTTKTKQKAHLYAAYKKLTSELYTHRLKVKGFKRIFHININDGNQGHNT